MDIADILIWASLGIILVLYLLPRILNMLGVGVEKRSKGDQD